jgi:hypothetical protein
VVTPKYKYMQNLKATGVAWIQVRRVLHHHSFSLRGQRIRQARNQHEPGSSYSSLLTKSVGMYWSIYRRQLQENLSAPIGLFTEQNDPVCVQDSSPVSISFLMEQIEPIRHITRITSICPEELFLLSCICISST